MKSNQGFQDSPLKKIPQDIKPDDSKVLLKSQYTKIGGKKEHKRYLAFYEKYILISKNSDYNKPHRMFNLDFDSKFEVFREPPTLKPSAQSKNSKPESIKPEDIVKLGQNCEKTWNFTSTDQDALQKIRDLLGQRVNQMGFHQMFKVFKKIGKGNFASVYLAERIEDGKQMAIKAFSKAAVYSEENGKIIQKEGLVNEITLMRQMDCYHVMKLYEVYETANSLYMGLELLEGGQLYDYLKKKVIFQNKEIQIIIKGLLVALKHMHSKEIMHRDIKLENILFKKPNDINSVVLADFGLATYVNEPEYLYCRCGTPGFVAPEVINITDMKTRYDSVCDVYSLGLVFHILLTGKPAFPGRSYNTIVQQNKDATINFKSKVFDVVAPQALELLKQMLEPDPKKRIKAEDALKHIYLEPVMGITEPVPLDENFEDIDDQSDLTNRIKKINEETQRFDMLRINQFTQSPIQSPMIHSDLRGIRPLERDGLMMKTPVMTGRRDSVERGSPSMPSAQQGPRKLPQGASVLSQYTQKPQQQQGITQSKPQTKEESKEVKNVKSNLFKNI